MAQITEDYVSFETAQLLKEKEFDVECDYLYVDGKLVRAHGGACNWNDGETLFADYKNECSAPTLQMAMKWLREIHNIIIIVRLFNSAEHFYLGEPNQFTIDVATTTMSSQKGHIRATYSTYEEACEAGIKYCLENLI